MEQAHACKSSINSILQQPNLAVLSFNVNFHTHFPTPWVCTLCSGCLLPHVCTLTLHLPQGSDTPFTEFSLILHPKVSLPLHTTSPRVLAHFTFCICWSASQGKRPGLGWTLALAAHVEDAQSMCVEWKSRPARLSPNSPREGWRDDVPNGVQKGT